MSGPKPTESQSEATSWTEAIRSDRWAAWERATEKFVDSSLFPVE